MRVQRCGADELLGYASGDAMVRAFAPGAARAWRGDGAVAMVAVDAELRIPVLLGVGADAAVAEVVAFAARDGDMPGEVTVPRGGVALLPSWLRPERVDKWEWRALGAPPPQQPGEERVAWLTEDDHADVKALLTAANPGSSVWPGDAAARRWAGVRDEHGLRACLADTSRTPAIGHVSGIATAPDARGLGYGTAITAWAARRLFAEGAELVTLGVYADNTAAGRLYDRLGFSDDHRMGSGRPPR